ncbi:MAG: peptide chain release factor 2 [Candidatus Omnitrophica bacterium]|nr:peptide chain release factor 2 [Candidatus Omnitrophota bacterium]
MDELTIHDFKERLTPINKRLDELRGVFDLATREKEIDRLNTVMAEDGFWNNQTKAQDIIVQLKRHKQLVDPWKKLSSASRDLIEMLDIISDDDPAALCDFNSELKKIEKQTEQLEFEKIFSDPLDNANAIVSINAGAGGTESCDWASMLHRMYQRWAEKQDFAWSIFDILPGEEAGIKNVTFFVRGPLAYGYLKAERGVHRLVRISPFDSGKRRHTSFASVDVIAEVADTADIEIGAGDIRIDTYRAGGAGGQHVNKTDSAVRITHLETGIVVQCQNERSQHKNKSSAMKVLKARLYQRKKQEEDKELQKKYGEKKEIAWGSQIRSYVMHPYSMVKDHRTKHETSNVQAVMDGAIDEFIEAYLRQQLSG